MQLISKYKKGICFFVLLMFFSIYACVIPLQDKNGETIIMVFQKILDELSCKPNKIWTDKGRDFYNRSLK